ncbi:MAG: hypothetical protein JW955_19785 [Sedimentisphaerales bacterium]|nr:hypothetical protein [Sedimentisphaerales bacterium]
MARELRIDIIVCGGFAGLMLMVCGCGSGSGSGPRVQTEPQADESKSAVDLTLRLTPKTTATYRTTLEQEKSVTWQGAESTRPAGFEDGRSDNRIEMTFEQEVESIDASGDAIVRITIRALKYSNRIHNRLTLDFDSENEASRANPLARLIGQSYRIKLSRRGDMLEVVDAAEARSAIPADSPAHSTAQRLLSDEGIKERHTLPPLAALTEDTVRPGQSWTSVKSFSFSMMGSKSFERVYTLREVSEGDDGRLAIVDMKAIPAAGQTPGPQAMGPFGASLDTTSNYSGRCVFELENGRVRECSEQMRTEWLMLSPEAAQGEADPAAVKMAANWLRRLELVK